MSGGGRKRRGHEEEHENHERWLVTYADMLTVLSWRCSSSCSPCPSSTRSSSRSSPRAPTATSATAHRCSTAAPACSRPAAPRSTCRPRSPQAAARESDDLAAAREKILHALALKNMEKSVRFTLDERGLVVTVVTDDVLFALGSATLRPQGGAVLDAIAPALKSLPNQITVEGHTDDLPISGRYGSNWELSTERATSVLRYLLDRHALPASRLSAAGYADQRPLTPNASAAARSTNRRVEVIVRATPVQALAARATLKPIPAIAPLTAVSDPVPPVRAPGADVNDQHATDEPSTDEEH